MCEGVVEKEYDWGLPTKFVGRVKKGILVTQCQSFRVDYKTSIIVWLKFK